MQLKDQQNRRILVIDDNEKSTKILKKFLNQWGILCQSAAVSIDAFSILQTSNPFDVILVDSNMPYMGGLETIRFLREKMKTTNETQKIIFINNSLNEQKIYEECKKLEVYAIISKPVLACELLQSLIKIEQSSSDEAINSEIILTAEKKDFPVKMKTLIAEDVRMNFLLLRSIIRNIFPDAIFFEAKDGREALQVFLEKGADLILLDVQMPEKDGYQVAKEIRDIEKNTGKHVPIVAVTAGALPEDRERCLAAGMDEYLSKPIDIEEMKRILKKFDF